MKKKKFELQLFICKKIFRKNLMLATYNDILFFLEIRESIFSTKKWEMFAYFFMKEESYEFKKRKAA